MDNPTLVLRWNQYWLTEPGLFAVLIFKTQRLPRGVLEFELSDFVGVDKDLDGSRESEEWRYFAPAVEAGVKEAFAEREKTQMGLRVTLIGIEFHEVDSRPLAFHKAAKNAITYAVKLLETDGQWLVCWHSFRDAFEGGMRASACVKLRVGTDAAPSYLTETFQRIAHELGMLEQCTRMQPLELSASSPKLLTSTVKDALTALQLAQHHEDS